MRVFLGAEWLKGSRSSENIINVPEDKRVIVQGLEGFIVVEYKNTLLICKKEDEQKDYKMREFVRRSFERSFRLGDHVDQDKVTAKLEDGVLNVVLPKREEVKPKVQKVKIN